MGTLHPLTLSMRSLAKHERHHKGHDELAGCIEGICDAYDDLHGAAKALIEDVRKRYPGEELICPHLRRLDALVNN